MIAAQLRVGHVHKPVTAGHTRIYVGRASSYKPALGEDFSVLGNPYAMRSEADRLDVIERYAAHLSADIKAAGPLSAALITLTHRIEAGEHLTLLCWCSPLACHADVIAEEIRLFLQPG